MIPHRPGNIPSEIKHILDLCLNLVQHSVESAALAHELIVTSPLRHRTSSFIRCVRRCKYLSGDLPCVKCKTTTTFTFASNLELNKQNGEPVTFPLTGAAVNSLVQSLLSCVAFGYGCENFSKYEQQGVGIQWHNLNQSPEEGERYTFLLSIVMMLVDALLYWILTWYIEGVFPGLWWTTWPSFNISLSSLG